MQIYFFLAVSAAFIVIFLISNGSYRQEVNLLDKTEYPLRGLMPIGLWTLDILRYKHNLRYDQKLFVKISELRGYKNARHYLRIHWANKITLIFMLVIFGAFILLSIEEADITFFVFYIGIIILAFYLIDKEIDVQISKRRMMIQYDFPEFVSKLILLVNAGLGVSRSWAKIVDSSKNDSPLYKELQIVLFKLESGKSEHLAYEEFARRCRIPEITKFVSILVQHNKKGNTDLVPALRLQAFECWQMRKNVARRFGEEASVKMIFPLMLMFIAVLIIVAAPAVIFITF